MLIYLRILTLNKECNFDFILNGTLIASVWNEHIVPDISGTDVLIWRLYMVEFGSDRSTVVSELFLEMMHA